jgi:hypothetical protein
MWFVLVMSRHSFHPISKLADDPGFGGMAALGFVPYLRLNVLSL